MTRFGTYTIDPAHTSVEFAVRHMMISTVKGRFGEVVGTLEIPEQGPPQLVATIQSGSIDTRSEQRDAHLRSPDFFDVERFPVLHFRSTSVERVSDGFTVVGDLTIRDVTRPVTLHVTEEGAGVDPWGNEKAGYTATTKFNRSDFGLSWNAALETGGVLVSDEVRVALDVQLVKQATVKAA
jgi:polyisoprenoid-binding protein YceI